MFRSFFFLRNNNFWLYFTVEIEIGDDFDRLCFMAILCRHTWDIYTLFGIWYHISIPWENIFADFSEDCNHPFPFSKQGYKNAFEGRGLNSIGLCYRSRIVYSRSVHDMYPTCAITINRKIDILTVNLRFQYQLGSSYLPLTQDWT